MATNLTTLVKDDIVQLIQTGWQCSDPRYKALCSESSRKHKDVTHFLVYDPKSPSSSSQTIINQVKGASIVLNVGEAYFPGRGVRAWVRRHVRRKMKSILIPPGKFLFFTTREAVDLPMDLEGSLFMNPKVSNLGLLFFTLGHVDPGFNGYLTATLLNMTDRPIYLDPSEPPLRLVFSRTEKPTWPHSEYHYSPQLNFDIAVKNLAISRNPGFALTSRNLVTKSELYLWVGLTLAIVFGLFGFFVAFFKH